MKILVACLVVLIVSPIFAASTAQNHYQQATIIGVEQRASTRVLYYVVNTPITKDDPYYDVSVQLNGIAYSARFTPRHQDEDLPGDWKAGTTVQARVQGRHLVLKSPAGTEVEFVITKMKRAAAQSLQVAPANK